MTAHRARPPRSPGISSSWFPLGGGGDLSGYEVTDLTLAFDRTEMDSFNAPQGTLVLNVDWDARLLIFGRPR